MSKKTSSPIKKRGSSSSNLDFVFKKQNYLLLLLAIAVVIIGFLLMLGREDIYSFTKITIAPFVIVLGFGIGFYAILYKPKKTSK